jgi:alanyl-tRNA synthetase
VTSSGAVIRVDNVQLYGSFVLHVGQVTDGSVAVGDSITCRVDYVRRAPIASNHTMTHVLNFALREVLNNRNKESSTVEVEQKGSLVDEFKLRFDFSWNGPVSLQQLAEVEQICVERIENAIPVDAYVAPLEGAQKISSLRAVFGETYPDPVRVVSVGPTPVPAILANPQDATWNQYSIEFCGGTHLTNTKEAQAFVLLNEEGIAKGIRRITAVTMADAQKAQADADAFQGKLTAAGQVPSEELEELVKQLTVELNSLSISAVKKVKFRDVLLSYSKKVVAYNKEKAIAQTQQVVDDVVRAASQLSGNKVVFRHDFGIQGKIAKSIGTAYAKQVKDKALFLISGDEESDRILVMAFCPKGVDVDCNAWVTSATEGTGGKGGGKKDSAQSTVEGLGHIESIIVKARSF